MNVLAVADWAFSAVAWSLGVVGAAFLLWSLFWDRARGRKRCPKCWYDMAGAASLVCPECGRDARRPGRLLRTRRRWRWACLALFPLLAAYPVGVIPEIRRDGWWAGAPRWALILAVPQIRVPQASKSLGWREGLYKQVVARLFREGPNGFHFQWWERPFIVPSALRALETDDDDAQRVGVQLLVASRQNAVEIAPRGARGLVAVVAAARAHADARSYEGAAVTTTDLAVYTSHIVVDASRGCRWEISNAADASAHSVMWATENPVASVWFRGTTHTSSPFTTAVMMSASVPGVAAGPLALFGYMSPRFGIDVNYLGDLTWIGLDTVDATLCDHIVGRSGQHETHVWIERATHLIKRVRYTDPVHRGTTTFRGQFNVSIDDALLQFDPNHPNDTPLMRGEVDLPSVPNP